MTPTPDWKAKIHAGRRQHPDWRHRQFCMSFGGTVAQVAEALGEPRQPASNRSPTILSPPIPTETHLRARMAQLEAQLRDRFEAEGAIAEAMADIKGAVLAAPPVKVRVPPAPAKPGRHPVAMVLHWTDWHMGQNQPSDEIEGFGETSPALLREGMRKVTGRQMEWLAYHRHTYVVDECRILCTGDMISGDIHEELRVTNEWPSPRQTVEAADLLAELVLAIAPHFPQVTVDFLTVDNHSRLTRKPQHGEAGFNTFNYPLAAIAQARLARQANVTFHVHPMEQKVVGVKGRQYLLCHGHQVMGWAGFPWYGVERKAGREAVKRMVAGHGKFDKIIMGHWHTPLAHPLFWIGGSATGTSAYDHSAGRQARPCQCAWFAHPVHGEFDWTTWYLR